MKKVLTLALAAASVAAMSIPAAAEVTPVDGIEHCYYNYICNKSVNEVKADGVYHEEEWSDAVPLVINNDTIQEFGRWQSAGDPNPASELSCTYRFKWDEKYFYILEVRTDAAYVSDFEGNDYNALNPWMLDGTAIFFCDNYIPDASNRCDIKFYSYVDEIKAPSVFVGNGGEEADGYKGPSGEADTTYGGSVNGDTIVFEMKLAWQVLEDQWHLDSAIEEGTVFRFTPIIMNRSTIDDYGAWDGSSYRQINFHDCVNIPDEGVTGAEDPNYWAALTLSAAGAGSAEEAPAEEATTEGANGVIEATEGFANEGADMLFDGDETTKWCLAGTEAYVIWKTDAVTATGYEIVTANDNAEYPGRNPGAWTLSGSNDGTTWTAIDVVENDDILQDANFTPFTFVIDTPAEYNYYKFEVSAVESGTLQISGLNLLTGSVVASEAPAEEIVGEAVEEPVVEDAVEEVVEAPVAEAPQTFDVAVLAAVSAVLSLAGFAVSKKK